MTEQLRTHAPTPQLEKACTAMKTQHSQRVNTIKLGKCRLWFQPQPSDPASEAPQRGLEICQFLQHKVILEAIKLLEPLPRRKHTLGNAVTEYIPNFHDLYLNMDMDAIRNKIYIYLIVGKKKKTMMAHWLLFILLHLSGLKTASNQEQVVQRESKCVASSALSSFILYGEVHSHVFLSCLFLRNHLHSFYKKMSLCLWCRWGGI